MSKETTKEYPYRELKFRAWNVMNGMQYDVCKYGGDWGLDDWIRHTQVMQYTGLRDLDGKEIYEGDVLEAKDDIYCEIGDVAYRDGAFWCMGGGSQDFKCYRVIGNIYENPELLEKSRVLVKS